MVCAEAACGIAIEVPAKARAVKIAGIFFKKVSLFNVKNMNNSC